MMRYVLSAAGREVLTQLSWSRVLLAFDFDGTLAPIVNEPAAACLRPRTHALLARLAALYPCAVISGRSRADTRRRLDGVPVAVVGNHGAEAARSPTRPRAAVRAWRNVLTRELQNVRGIEIEDKGYSLAVHYRRSREKKRARQAIVDVVSGLGDVRLVGGKMVVNVLPSDAPHKGMALERERASYGCDTALYVGDDETDEDVFALDQPGQLLTIRVGRNGESLAAYYVRSQLEIDRLLAVLIGLRQGNRRGVPA